MNINFRTNTKKGLDLRGAILEGADLRGAFLEGAILESEDLTNFVLTGANLKNAKLEDAILEGAKLEGAHLEGAHLQDAILEGAHLQDAHLEGAHLENAHLENAELMGAHLEGAHLMSAHLTGANLTEAHFEGANLTWANLTDAILDNTMFTDAILDNTMFTDTVLGVEDGHQPPFAGAAYEVHNAFTTFQSKQNKYLAIINQFDFNDVYNDFDVVVEYIFKKNITDLFPIDDNKLTQFNNVFNKSKYSLRNLDPETLQLIYKSITFAFSQRKNFKVQYITTFLDETCNAYAGPDDNTSCVKGILERFVLSVGNAVQILCIAGCDDETYKDLDILMNSKFIIADAASSWWEWLGDDTSDNWKAIYALAPEERKENFIAYVKAEARRLGSAITNGEIEHYADEKIGYSFAELKLGGRKSSKKTKKYSRKSSKKSSRKSSKKSSKKSSRKSSKKSSKKSNKSSRITK